MRVEEVRKALEERGAIQEGHFLLSSGLHGDRYVQCARALEDPKLAGVLGGELAALAPAGAGAVVSPALGAVLLGYEVARALGVRFLFAEREGPRMALRRGFELRPGEPILVVEDVLTTGRSTREVLELARRAGAVALGVLALVDRSGGPLELGHPVRALLKMPLAAFKPPDCSLCASGRPLTKPGSRPRAAAP